MVEQTDSEPATVGDLTLIRFEPLGKQLQQGGFAVTVSTHYPDSIAIVDANGDVVEDILGRKADDDVFDAEKVGQVTPPTIRHRDWWLPLGLLQNLHREVFAQVRWLDRHRQQVLRL